MNRSHLVLPASALVTFVLGSVHAFSVFVAPLEAQLGLPRSQVSLIYSFALVFITLSVLFGHRIYALVPAWQLVTATCTVATVGLSIAVVASNWWMLFFGYSVLFGVSNGVGYGFTLQLVARALPSIKGFAMGAVTASYAVGSIVFTQIIAFQISTASPSAAFGTLAAAMIGCAVVSGALMALSGANYSQGDVEQIASDFQIDRRKVSIFWVAYMLSVFAGLMAIGHAAGIVVSKGASTQLSIQGAMMIGVGSALGGFLAGWLVDFWPIRRFLIGLPLLSAVSLLMLSYVESPSWAILLLCGVGFAYGSIIAIYPVAVSNIFGDDGPKVYGSVFTGWGFAGLVAPWTAGLIFDMQASYQLALVGAGVTAFLSAVVVGLGQIE
jgi:OFA family oxalate/formate antiporter-like MFS transporter